MKRLLFLLPLVFLIGCQLQPKAATPIVHVAKLQRNHMRPKWKEPPSKIKEEPAWLLDITVEELMEYYHSLLLRIKP